VIRSILIGSGLKTSFWEVEERSSWLLKLKAVNVIPAEVVKGEVVPLMLKKTREELVPA